MYQTESLKNVSTFYIYETCVVVDDGYVMK